MIKTFVKTSLCALMASALIAGNVAPTLAAPAAKPLSAGKDGTKSNAGGGNGAEAASTGTSATTTTFTTSLYDVYLEPTQIDYLTAPETTVVVTSKVASGSLHHSGNNTNSALKQNYLVTTTTTTWDGTKYVETTQVEIWEEKVTSTVVSTTYADLDPGNSTVNNEAPEADSVVETSAPVVETTNEYVEDGEPIVETVGEFTPNVVDTTTTVSEQYNPNAQGGN